MVLVIHTCIILQNIGLVVWRDGYESELFTNALSSVENGHFLDEDGNEKPFFWCTREGFESTTGVVNDTQWDLRLELREAEIMNEAHYFGLKHDLAEHLWENQGLRTQC